MNPDLLFLIRKKRSLTDFVVAAKIPGDIRRLFSFEKLPRNKRLTKSAEILEKLSYRHLIERNNSRHRGR